MGCEMNNALQELLAASAMMTRLERIVSSGVLSEEDEHDVRLLIIRAGQAFGLTSLAERPCAPVVEWWKT